ncbi:MAG TPA: pilus assembly protein TadB, partial [Syntrophus sp. (in: bacteria)]|nr:pilus assembly protein TadB [Syntrophus sp. (in: bacteria)]
KFNGHVRVLASQAKLSANILFAVPFITALVIKFLNPKYFDALLENPSGKMVLVAGVCWMIIGIVFIRKMVKIRV